MRNSTITPIVIMASVDGINRAEFGAVPKLIPAGFGVLEWLEDHLGSTTVEEMNVETYDLPEFMELLNDEYYPAERWCEDFYIEEEQK